MGRTTSPLGEADRSIRLFIVRLDSGGYDDGGAYRGYTNDGTSLYCAQCEEGGQQFIRAGSRERAAFGLGITNPQLKKSLDGAGIPWGLAVIDGRAPMPEGSTKADIISWLESTGKAFFGSQKYAETIT